MWFDKLTTNVIILLYVSYNAVIACFEEDYPKFAWIKLDTVIISQATSLLNQYGTFGLRTLDAIQLSSALTHDTVFFTHDKLLKSVFEQEGLSQ